MWGEFDGTFGMCGKPQMSGKNGTFESERFSGIESPILTFNYTKKPKSKFWLKGKVKSLQPTPNVLTVSDAKNTFQIIINALFLNTP